MSCFNCHVERKVPSASAGQADLPLPAYPPARSQAQLGESRFELHHANLGIRVDVGDRRHRRVFISACERPVEPTKGLQGQPRTSQVQAHHVLGVQLLGRFDLPNAKTWRGVPRAALERCPRALNGIPSPARTRWRTRLRSASSAQHDRALSGRRRSCRREESALPTS